MKRKILFVLCLLFGLMFINSGLNKIFNYLPVPEDMPEEIMKVMGAFMQITWLMPLIAVVEIIGGLLFIIPRFRALGALILFPIMVGILLFHIVSAPEGMVLTLILLAIYIWAMIEDREKYLPLIK